MASYEFKGRHKELAELNKRYNSGKKEFGVVYGRRRIGKSKLLNEFLKDKNGLLFQAKKDSAYGNLRSFSYEIDKFFNMPKNYVFSSFQEAFDVIVEKEENKRFVLVIDEYPYIVDQDASFSSVLQEFIDNAKDNIFVIVLGSDVSMLKKEILDHASPLYKRITFEMPINQMPYSEALEFVDEFDKENKFNYLSLFSTYPYYLSAIDKNVSFEENIKNLLFNQYGTFFTLSDQLLSNSTKVQDVYNAILKAIANRKRTNKEIADYIHEDDAKVSKYLSTLLDSEIVIKCETFMGNKKTNYYEIGDSLLKFWYAFIFDNQERIKINGERVFEECKDKIHQFISFGFEEVCRLYMNQLNIDGKLLDVFPKLKTYRVEKSKIGMSIEIDGLSRVNNNLLVIECKYRKEQFDVNMWNYLNESISVFPEKLNKVFYIFSKAGFTKDVKELKISNLNLLTLDDML